MLSRLIGSRQLGIVGSSQTYNVILYNLMHKVSTTFSQYCFYTFVFPRYWSDSQSQLDWHDCLMMLDVLFSGMPVRFIDTTHYLSQSERSALSGVHRWPKIGSYRNYGTLQKPILQETVLQEPILAPIGNSPIGVIPIGTDFGPPMQCCVYIDLTCLTTNELS